MTANCWVSVRHVLQHVSEPGDPLRYFEERIATWLARDLDHAIALAAEEVREYCEDLPGVVDTGLYQAYLLADDPGLMTSGIEAFSLIRGTALSTENYLAQHFETGQELTT